MARSAFGMRAYMDVFTASFARCYRSFTDWQALKFGSYFGSRALNHGEDQDNSPLIT
jgi:hypothetical protein